MASQAVAGRTIATQDLQFVQHALYQFQPQLPQSITGSCQLLSYGKGTSNLLRFQLLDDHLLQSLI